MKKLALTGAFGAACLSLAACGGETNTADANGVAGEAAGAEADSGATGTAAAASFPKGARIVEEKGVTYRIDPDGTRVTLGDTDSRIVVEDGVRFRVDPDGTRVRIDPEGVAIDVDGPDVDVDLPDVDVGINKKGNPDIDINEGDRPDNKSR
jgi:hypothetical protein